MKIEEVTKPVINPPSMPEALQIPTPKKENTHPLVENKGEGANLREVFAEENQKAIQNLAEHINKLAKNNQFSIKFIPEKEAGLVIIKVYDAQGKLVRQIPPEEILALSAELGKKKGFLLNLKM